MHRRRPVHERLVHQRHLLEQPRSNCCQTTAECIDELGEQASDACVVPQCQPNGVCETVGFHDTARCGVEDCATDADCQRECSEDGRCWDFCLVGECFDWPCTQGACTAQGRCVFFDGDCTGCAIDDDCVDADPCTEDACAGDGTCRHTTLSACTPTPCVDGYCDSGDPCTLGLCLSGGCVWMPNPACAP